MPLTLVTGPANAAKAGYVLERLRAVLHRGPLLVVPTAADVSHYGQELAAGAGGARRRAPAPARAVGGGARVRGRGGRPVQRAAALAGRAGPLHARAAGLG